MKRTTLVPGVRAEAGARQAFSSAVLAINKAGAGL
jgi:hypothetical protein